MGEKSGYSQWKNFFEKVQGKKLRLPTWKCGNWFIPKELDWNIMIGAVGNKENYRINTSYRVGRMFDEWEFVDPWDELDARLE